MPARPETPLQAIESHAAQIHGDTKRLDATYIESREPDRLHDDAVDLCERAILAGDARTALRAIRDVRRHDAAEDAKLAAILDHTEAIRSRTRGIGGAVEMTEATWDRLADLLTVATFRAMRDGSAAYTTMQEILALVRTQTSHSSTRIDGLRVANATTEQLVASTDRLLDQMRSLVMEQAGCGATHPHADEMASEGVRLLQCDRGPEYHERHVFNTETVEDQP